jgi:uncharacterized protein (DUF58 family)
MFTTPRMAVGFVAAGVLAAVLPAPAFGVLLAACVAVLVLLVADVVLAPPPVALRVHRHAPDVARMSRPAEVALRFHNPTRRKLRVTLRDSTPPSLQRAPKKHWAVAGAGSWARVVAELRPTRRGNAILGPVTVRTFGPIGLGGRQRTLPSRTRIKIYPSLPGRAEVDLRLERARLLQSGERSSAIRGGGTDFDSLRDYHPDDEFRRINWRATARAAKPISNQYREERNQQLVLMLDASRMMAGSVAGVSRFEHALDGAIAIAELAGRIGDRVGMVAFGSDVLATVGPKGGRAQPRAILEALFDLEPALEAPNYPRAFNALLSRHRRRSLLVLLTELVEESGLESLLGALPVLLARHLVLVGSVLDPEVEALALLLPSSSEDAYLKAAAAESLAARDRAGQHLRRLGVGVVDAPPGALAGRLVDQYLRIKAFGRL